MDRYIGRLMLMPLAITIALSVILLILDKLLRLLTFVVGQSGSPGLVWALLINIVPTYVSFGLVVGLLLSVVLTFRRLAISSELDVLRGAGASYGRMLVVPVGVSVAVACLNFTILGFIQPKARYDYRRIQFALVSGALGAQLRLHDFDVIGRSGVLRVDRIVDGNLRGVFVKLATGRREIAIQAASAALLATADRTAVVLRLQNGVLVESMAGRAAPRTLGFTSYDLHLPIPSVGGLEPRGGDFDELSIADLARMSMVASAAKSKTQAVAHLNFRSIQLGTLLLLPFLGLSLAVPPKRSSSFLGVLVSIVLLVLWYKVLQFGLAEAVAGRIEPAFGQWGPFVVASVAVLWNFRVFARGVHDGPLSGAEALLATLWNMLRAKKAPLKTSKRLMEESG